MNTLAELETKVAQDGLTHAHMCDFFRLLNTSASDAVLPTFQKWIDDLTAAGVEIDTEWHDRIISDWTNHGRLTAETLLQAPEVPVIQIGDDEDVD